MPIHTILFVHSSNEMYGADLILLQLVELLPADQFRAVVVLPTDVSYKGLLSQALAERNIETIHLKLAVLRRKYFTPFGFLIYLWRFCLSVIMLIYLIYRKDVSIVHSNTAAVIPGAVAAWLTCKPHVWHIHEIIVQPKILSRFIAWLVPRLSDQIVAVSEATKKYLCLANSKNQLKTKVIYNGIDLNRFESDLTEQNIIRQEWKIRQNELVVGMIGRISHWKGQHYFLQVAQAVLRDQPLVRFVLIGGVFPGQEHLVNELEMLADQLRIRQSIVFGGFRQDIPAVLNAFDIFVLPSILPDPFPTVVLEAMAAKLPIVANAHGGSVEMIEQDVTGFLVEPNSINDMANAIKDLLSSEEHRRNMGQHGRLRLEQHFSLDAFLTKWLTLYKSLLITHTAV